VKKPDNKEQLLDNWLGLTGKAPMPEGPLVLPVLSGSMRPGMPLGSRILIEPCQADGVRVGDVTVYLEKDRLVAHRVLWFLGCRTRGWIFQKGDTNRFGHWIRSSSIRGVVREVLPAEDTGNPSVLGQGLDPYSPAAARRSRRDYLRNLILTGPRLLRDLVTGNRHRNRNQGP